MFKLRLRKCVFPDNRIHKYKTFKSFGCLIGYLLDHMFELSDYCIDIVIDTTLYCTFSPSYGLNFTGKKIGDSIEVKIRSIIGQLFSLYYKK